MGKGDSQHGLAGRVGITLAILTLITTVITSIPPFLALRGKEPYVVYEVGQSQMLYPQDADRRGIRKLLSEQSIPDAFETLSLSNRGDIASKEVIVSLSVPGQIVAERTEPNFEIKSAWVTVSKEFVPEEDPSRIRYILKNLGLARTYSIKVSYVSETLGNALWEVFYDGNPGVLVENLTSVPKNARAISFALTLKILVIGLLLSTIVYLIVRYRKVLSQFPFNRIIKQQMNYSGWVRYKDETVFELAKSEPVTLYSITEGSIDSLDPQEFWDAILEISGKRFVLEIHTSGQKWWEGLDNLYQQRYYCLRVVANVQKTEPLLSHVVIINDEDIWSTPFGEKLKSMFVELGGNVSFDFVSGEPQEVAKRILELANGCSD